MGINPILQSISERLQYNISCYLKRLYPNSKANIDIKDLIIRLDDEPIDILIAIVFSNENVKGIVSEYNEEIKSDTIRLKRVHPRSYISEEFRDKIQKWIINRKSNDFEARYTNTIDQMYRNIVQLQGWMRIIGINEVRFG